MAAEWLKTDFYILNLLNGIETNPNAKILINHMTKKLRLGGFNLVDGIPE